MAKKLILLTSFLFVLALAGSAWAGFSEPVDLALRIHDPPDCSQDPDSSNYDPDCQIYLFPPTLKDGWTGWGAFKDTGEPHDARSVCDVNGSGMCFGIANAARGSHMVFGVSASPYDVDPICNSWLRHEDEIIGDSGEYGGGDTHLLLWGPGLLAGEYEVLIYHNRTEMGGDPCDPNFALMPRVSVQTYCSANILAQYPPYERIDNGGAPLMDDCNLVVPIVNDVNVWVQSVTTDAELIPSYVKFEILEDGASIHIVAKAPFAGTACINAFIVKAPSAPWAFSPSPGSGSENVCPDVVLSWESGTEANSVNGQDLYFSTDYNDVNDREAAAHIGLQSDTNYAPPGDLDFGQTYYWRVDSVNDPCMTPGTVWDFTVETGKAYNPSPPDGGWSVESTAVSWSPSCLATSHDVYYADNWEDVNDGSAFLINWPSPSIDLGGIIDPGKRYYWRIDEKGPVTFPKGDVWTFQARGGAVVQFSFEGTLDANLPNPTEDDTNNVRFGRGYGSGSSDTALLTYGEANPLVNPLGTSAHFQPVPAANSLVRQVYGFDVLDLDKNGYTIEMWVNQDQRTTQGTKSDFGGSDFAASLVRRYDLGYIVAIDGAGALRFAHGGEDNDIASSAGAIPLDEWVHVGAVYDGDGSDPCKEQKLYIGGELVATGWAPAPNPYDDDDVAIGGAQKPRRDGWPNMGNPFYGYIDELRISDVALKASQFLIRGDTGLAWLPKPPHGKTKVSIVNPKLIWKPGDLAGSHDIYLGTSWDDVNDGATAVSMGNQEPNEYSPASLELGTTYYWRVDEVNDTNAYKWRGTVWKFTTANFVVIDDFEQYDTGANAIFNTWEDGNINLTGSFIDLGRVPFDEAYDSDQSMFYIYDNKIQWDWEHYWSMVSRLVDFTDWDSLGLKVLTLHFYGDPTNDANNTEELYVAVADNSGGGGNYTEARYGVEGYDNGDLRVAEWHEFHVPLSRFSDGGVDLGNVETIYVGFGDKDNTDTAGGEGAIYLDEIWLQRPICLPAQGPQYDLDGDCIIAWGDISVIGDEWLKTDLDFRPPQAPPGPVGHWALDGNADDSSGNTNHGVAEGEYAYVDGRIGANSIEFTDDIGSDGGRVLVPDAPSLTPAAEVTVSAWVNMPTSQNDSGRVVVKGADNKEAYAIQMSGTNPDFMLRDPCGINVNVNSDVDLEEDEWAHIAGSYDGSKLKFYVNGHLTNSKDANTFGLFYDANGLAIGNRSDAMDRACIGKIDDVAVYDVALSQAQVVHIASEGTGYMPVDSPAEIYTSEPEGQKAVNIKDVATLLTAWLEEKMWP